MNHGSGDLDQKLLTDFIRWYAYDGSVGGLENVIEDNQYTYDVHKNYLDLVEKRR